MERHRIERSRIFAEEIAQMEIPRRHKLRNFWLNILTTTHKVPTHTLLQTTKIPEEIPKWLAKGITYLMSKTSEANNLKNYMHVYNIQTINLYYNKTHIFISRTK